MKTNKSFSINHIELSDKKENKDFAFAEIYFLSDGNNGQNCPISTKTLKKYADTVKGKFIVAKYHSWLKDVGTHETDEVIIGYVPPNSKVRFEYSEEYEKTFAICESVISKIYGTDVYNLFLDNNERSVSSEFVCNTSEEDGEGEILEFDINGITILGKRVNPAVKGANIQIKKFSEDEAETYYNNVVSTSLKDFAEQRKNQLKKTYKINKKDLKTTPWGDVDKTKMRNKIMDAKNRATLVKNVYALVEDGWEEAPSEHLKYPIMQLVGDTFYYNRYALSSALAYAKQENEQSVIDKVEKIYKKFKIEDKEDKMKDTKTFAVEISNLWEMLYTKIRKMYDYDMCIYGIYEEDGQKFVIIKDREFQLYKLDFDIVDTEINFIGDEVKVEATFVEKETIKEFAEKGDKKYTTFAKEEDVVMKEKETDEKDDKKDIVDEDEKEKDDDNKDDDKEDKKSDEKDKEDKKFSLNSYADMGAIEELLKEETEQNKELANKVVNEMDAVEIVKTVLEISAENEELKNFKADKIEEEKQAKVFSIMAKVKTDINSKSFEELTKEGMSLSVSELGGFENKVKAFAYESTKNNKEKTDDGYMKFASSDIFKQEKSTIKADDIFKQYK